MSFHSLFFMSKRLQRLQFFYKIGEQVKHVVEFVERQCFCFVVNIMIGL